MISQTDDQAEQGQHLNADRRFEGSWRGRGLGRGAQLMATSGPKSRPVDQVEKQNRQKDRAEQTGVNFFDLEFEGRVGQPHADAADLGDVFEAEHRFENVGERQAKAAEDRRRHRREQDVAKHLLGG